MLVLVGLGNPGNQYRGHRHNVGFMAIDAIAEAHGFEAPKKKFQGLLQEGHFSGPTGRQKILLLKPQTYMNESGRSLGELLRFYKLSPEHIIVFHDELDLAPGKLRLKTGGGHAGHNGLRSIDAHIGNNFTRVRIGIGHPGSKTKVHGYVLSDFAKIEQAWLHDLLTAIAACAPHLAEKDTTGHARFQSDVAYRMNPTQQKKQAISGTDTHKAQPADTNGKKPILKKSDSVSSPSNPFKDALSKILPGKDQS